MISNAMTKKSHWHIIKIIPTNTYDLPYITVTCFLAIVVSIPHYEGEIAILKKIISGQWKNLDDANNNGNPISTERHNNFRTDPNDI